MSHNPLDFRDQLLQREIQTPALREKYEQELQAMFEKRLGVSERGIWCFWTIFSLVLAAVFSWATITSSGDVSLWGTVIFSLGVVFGLAFAGLSAWIAYSGRLLLKSQPRAMVGMAWGLTVIVTTICLVAAPDSIVGLRMLLTSLIFLMMAAVFMLAGRAERAELRTNEKLLEIEYRLAELSETIGRSRAS